MLRREQRPDGARVVIYRGRVIERGPRMPTEEEQARSRAILAEMKALAEEIGRYLPPGTSAVDAVREQRRR